jgi:hypothetical protein
MKFVNAMLASALLATGVAQAQTVTAVPSSPEVMVGDFFTVDLIVSGLDDATVGSFDFDFIYDPFLMTSYGVVFGEGLDVFSLGSLFSVSSAPGLINIAQTSFDTTEDLIALQPDSFTLATLSFKAIGLGMIPLEVLVNAIGDAEGMPLAVDLGIGSVTSVPEPQTYALLLAGLGMIALAARRRRS